MPRCSSRLRALRPAGWPRPRRSLFRSASGRSPSSASWAMTTCAAALERPRHAAQPRQIDDTADLQRAPAAAHTWKSTAGPSPTGRSSRPTPGRTRPRPRTRARMVRTNLPDDMCVIGSGGFAHFAEYLTWLMGYETLCYALYDQRDLVHGHQRAADRHVRRVVQRICCAVRPRARWSGAATTWASDRHADQPRRPARVRAAGPQAHGRDAPRRRPALPAALLRQPRHDHGRPDRRREDRRQALVRGHDRARARKPSNATATASRCWAASTWISSAAPTRRPSASACARRWTPAMPGGGYCLGTGNSVANYIPLDNYLAMLDEGRRYSR